MVTPVDFNREQDPSSLLVRACTPGKIIINDQSYSSNLLLSPSLVLPDWQVDDPASIAAADFDDAVKMEPDLIIFGTGDKLVFPDTSVSAALLARGIGFEVMDTRAACRTYNLLAMDRRSVVAALLQLSEK